MLRILRSNKVQNEIEDYSLKLDHLCQISTSGFVIEDRSSNTYACSENLTQFSSGFSLGSIDVDSGDFDLSSFTLSFTFMLENDARQTPVMFDDSFWVEIDSERVVFKSYNEEFYKHDVSDLGGYFWFAISRNGKNASCYVNGKNKKTFGITMPNYFSMKFIAEKGGYIDKIYLYEHQFDDERIKRLYSSFIFPSYWTDGFGYVSTSQCVSGRS